MFAVSFCRLYQLSPWQTIISPPVPPPPHVLPNQTIRQYSANHKHSEVHLCIWYQINFPGGLEGDVVAHNTVHVCAYVLNTLMYVLYMDAEHVRTVQEYLTQTYGTVQHTCWTHVYCTLYMHIYWTHITLYVYIYWTHTYCSGILNLYGLSRSAKYICCHRFMLWTLVCRSVMLN